MEARRETGGLSTPRKALRGRGVQEIFSLESTKILDYFCELC
jgi:hypothetical protein